jgi:hypothetical protein
VYSVVCIDKTRQDKTRQDKTRQDKTRQDKTRQDKLDRVITANMIQSLDNDDIVM